MKRKTSVLFLGAELEPALINKVIQISQAKTHVCLIMLSWTLKSFSLEYSVLWMPKWNDLCAHVQGNELPKQDQSKRICSQIPLFSWQRVYMLCALLQTVAKFILHRNFIQSIWLNLSWPYFTFQQCIIDYWRKSQNLHLPAASE